MKVILLEEIPSLGPAGAVVEDVSAVSHTVMQGANFSQVRRAGVRLVLQTPGGK